MRPKATSVTPSKEKTPGFEFLGFHIRQYRVGKHQSGKRPCGQRLGYKTLIKPAKANIQEHLAELGRIIRRSKALPQSEVIRQLNPNIRGWAHYYRIGVSKAVYAASTPSLGPSSAVGHTDVTRPKPPLG